MLTELVKFLSTPSLERDSISWGVLALIIASIFVDVSKIPINPWKHIIKGISGIFNAEIITCQKDLEHKVDSLGATFQAKHDAISKTVEKIEADQLEGQKRAVRRRIISFADDCRRDVSHSQQAFITVLDDVNEYERLCRLTGDSNHVVDDNVSYIDQLYRERLEKNDFI